MCVDEDADDDNNARRRGAVRFVCGAMGGSCRGEDRLFEWFGPRTSNAGCRMEPES